MISILRKSLQFGKNLFKGELEIACIQFKITRWIYALCLHIIHSVNVKHSNKLAVFSLEEGFRGRDVFNVINAFKLSGYDIKLIPNRNFYKSCKEIYIFYVYKFLKVGFYNSLKKYKYSKIFIISDKTELISLNKFDKALTVKYQHVSEINKLTLPYSFHPMVFILNKFKTNQELETYLKFKRKTKRTVKVLFGGQTNHKMYYQLNACFKDLINRNDLFKYLNEEFRGKISFTPQERKLSGMQILIADRSNNNFNPKDWLDFLPTGSFFISPPGFEMPVCHNIIEAMGVGVIPILQYNNYFDPNLEHKKKLFSF